jgi:flagella basal body P-ring formation protein FlgA
MTDRQPATPCRSCFTKEKAMLRILIPALLLATPAAAQTAFQDTAGLDRAVASFTGHSIGEEGGARTAIDRRLKLAQCPTVALSWHGINHDAVTVTCSGPNWHVYVPVVMAAVQPKSPSIAPTVIMAVRPEIVIHRGDPVMVEASQAGFTISREAIAQGDAAAGQRFMAKGQGDKQSFQAVAIDSGRATLPGWPIH